MRTMINAVKVSAEAHPKLAYCVDFLGAVLVTYAVFFLPVPF